MAFGWLVVLIVGMILALSLCGFWLRHWHIGCGMLIVHYKDGRAVIVSRLLKSPAHEAGIANGARLLKLNGVPLQGLPVQEFMQKLSPLRHCKLGSLVTCTVAQEESGEIVEKTVSMRARMIYTSIPDWSRHTWVKDVDGHYTHGCFYCLKTGQWVPTQRLPEEAFENIFR